MARTALLHLRTPLLSALLALSALTAYPADDAPTPAPDGRRKQEIRFAEIGDHSADDGPFRLPVTATSGLPVTLEILSGPAVIDAGRIKLTRVPGLVIVRATQAGNALFLPAGISERAFAVHAEPSAPQILHQPAASVTRSGGSTILSVSVVGVPPPAFQWRRDGVPIAGATEPTFTADAAGSYDVVITNRLGRVTTVPVRISAASRSQTITFPPPSASIPAGQSVQLTAVSTSGLPVQFEVVLGQATLSGNQLTGQQGTVVIKATQEGDASYDPASPVTQTFYFTPSANQLRP